MDAETSYPASTKQEEIKTTLRTCHQQKEKGKSGFSNGVNLDMM